MKIITYPDRKEWPGLCARPFASDKDIRSGVADILNQVRQQGDAALFELTRRFDGARLSSLSRGVPETTELAPPLRAAIDMARSNIEQFHRAQKRTEKAVETQPGVLCWRRAVPVERVGLYIPGGSAPLFSTLLMLAVPARLAGCREIVVCTPPNADGHIAPAILYTARILGIKRLFTIGGAQAVAAMCYGTESVPRVDKIFGPGNRYVTLAKQMAQSAGTAIDMPAGPSEVLIISDGEGNPAFIAADLLSQAEHGTDSQVIFLCTSASLINAVEREIEKQLTLLPRRETAASALAHSKMILLHDLREALELSNLYAPEHLILATDSAGELAEDVVNAGSVFIGSHSCESAGDYASGTNHTLPTNGHAAAYSGVSLDSFVKMITFQKISARGLKKIGPAIELMAEAEQLLAHRNAVTLRLREIKDV